jgi:hypothetical protein
MQKLALWQRAASEKDNLRVTRLRPNVHFGQNVHFGSRASFAIQRPHIRLPLTSNIAARFVQTKEAATFDATRRFGEHHAHPYVSDSDMKSVVWDLASQPHHLGKSQREGIKLRCPAVMPQSRTKEVFGGFTIFSPISVRWYFEYSADCSTRRKAISMIVCS